MGCVTYEECVYIYPCGAGILFSSKTNRKLSSFSYKSANLSGFNLWKHFMMWKWIGSYQFYIILKDTTIRIGHNFWGIVYHDNPWHNLSLFPLWSVHYVVNMVKLKLTSLGLQRETLSNFVSCDIQGKLRQMLVWYSK